MEERAFVPDGPYVFQSGNHLGKAAELLMFSDYVFISWYHKKLNSMIGGKANRLHLHINWLIEQGENRTAKWLCPQFAHDSPIRYFLALGNPVGGYTISLQLTSCGGQECKEKLYYLRKGIHDRVLPLRFSSIVKFKMKADQNQVARFFQDAFGLPKRLTKEAAFRFFSDK